MEYYAYNDYLPDNGSQVDQWTRAGDAAGWTVAVEDDVLCNNGLRLRIDTPGAVSDHPCYYYHDSGDAWGAVDNAAGYKVEARIKVIDSGSVFCQNIDVYDGTYFFRVQWTGAAVFVDAAYIAEATQSHAIDLTDAYHTILIEVSGTALTVKIDGTLRISGTLDKGDAQEYIIFGDTYAHANGGGECYWDYIKYNLN